MTKITGLEQKTYQGKPSGWKVTFDDGRTGNLQEKESTKGLRVGDEVVVKEIPYTSKAGVQSTLYAATLSTGTAPSVAPSTAPPSASPPKSTPIPNDDFLSMRFEGRIKCIELAHQAYLSGKLEEQDAITHCKTWVILADDLINELRK